MRIDLELLQNQAPVKCDMIVALIRKDFFKESSLKKIVSRYKRDGYFASYSLVENFLYMYKEAGKKKKIKIKNVKSVITTKTIVAKNIGTNDSIKFSMIFPLTQEEIKILLDLDYGESFVI